MRRLIFHAGFPKCGSTTIVSTLRENLDLLIDNHIHIYNRNFELPDTRNRLQTPLWQLQSALSDAEEQARIRDQVTVALRHTPPASTAILSAENLSNPRMADMFKGLDEVFETTLIFYFRPQVDWIPSAWKQWDIKEGVDLNEAIGRYLSQPRPDYLGSVRQWLSVLPKLRVIARPLVPDMLKGGQPDLDFFDLLGLGGADLARSAGKSNPSIDYSLLHLLMRNSKTLFQNRHDNRVLRALLELLPQNYHRTNAAMLSQSQSDRISDAFHEGNRILLTEFAGMAPQQCETFLATYFRKTVTKPAYTEFPEKKIMRRACRILNEIGIAAENDDHVGALRQLAERMGPDTQE